MVKRSYKPGISPRRTESTDRRVFYESKDWKQVKKAYLSQAGHLCERCLAKGLVAPARVVHHKVYLTKQNVHDPSIALSFDNLEALCHDCHNKEHHRSDRRRYSFDATGRIVPTGADRE